jgi:predicted PurR-regulated permease PerM
MSPSGNYKISFEKNFAIWILLLFIGVLIYLNYKILKPFFAAVGWAIIISLIFHPIFEFIQKYFKYKGLSAFITIVLVMVLFLFPFVFLSYQIILDVREFIIKVNPSELFEKITTNPTLVKILEKFSFITGKNLESLENLIKEELTMLLKTVAVKIAQGFGDVLGLLINLVLTFFIAFFFLKDGDYFIKKIVEFLPFTESDKLAIKNQIKNIIYTTFYGGVLIAILQGTILGFTFYFLQIPSATLWGFATAIASFIPVLGAFSVWGPASIYLFLNGYILKGVILVLIGALLISSIDNILKPIIIRGKVNLPLVFIFLSVLGGIKFFGLIGFIVGPIIFSLFVSFLEILKNFVGGRENV